MIQTVFTTLFQVIVPLSIPVIAGALLKYFRDLDTKPLTTLFLYFLSPAIIFDTLMKAEISYGEMYHTLAFCILNLLILWTVARIAGKLNQLASPELAGLTLISSLTNSVNYGLPLVMLSFGQLGLDRASVYVVIQMIITNTFGVYLAARSQFSFKSAVKSVFTLPAIYTAMLAIVLRVFHLHLPAGVQTGVTMVAGAFSPVVLAILGAQMVGVKNANLDRKVQTSFWTGITIRLLISPLIACLCLYVLNIKGILFSVLLILSSMPVAVNAVVLAEKFNASPKLVSKSILWTTLASFILLPMLIVLVKQ
ncbi:AEC family transporter [Paenibacillus cremeus]|uniref:AEC family transporter n=1 Tax=Paenibacillus cremeus TaxID=2163881 RepID=A0A559KGX9_9BACL|nr:AEC family transporter [Paenibacillus cremeus]TVY11371.1 AEC family transporter [Paenibacillus cremeus]